MPDLQSEHLTHSDPASDIRHFISIITMPDLKVKHLTQSDPASNIRHFISIITMLDLKVNISPIQIQHPASSIKHQASSIQHLVQPHCPIIDHTLVNTRFNAILFLKQSGHPFNHTIHFVVFYQVNGAAAKSAAHHPGT